MIAKKTSADGKSETLLEIVSMSVDKTTAGKPTSVTLTTQNALGVQTPATVKDGIVTILAASGERLGAIDFVKGEVS